VDAFFVGVTEPEVESFAEWATLCGDDAQVICAGGEQHPSAQHAWRALSLPRTYQTMLADVLFLGGIAELKRIADFAALREVAISPHCPWVRTIADSFP
jgi:L-alanine-DL-glutamate epimerase-like enolase superfamily enzyme